jgi:hypothetical protein
MDSRNTELQLLHQLYTKYLEDLARDTGRGLPVRQYEDFVGWWWQLTPTVRARSERDYRRGYHAVIRDEKRQIADLVFGGGGSLTGD